MERKISMAKACCVSVGERQAVLGSREWDREWGGLMEEARQLGLPTAAKFLSQIFRFSPFLCFSPTTATFRFFSEVSLLQLPLRRDPYFYRSMGNLALETLVVTQT